MIKNKHPRKKARVNIDFSEDRTTVGICDEGQGFEMAGLKYVRSGEIGVAGMEERAELLGGTASISTSPG